MVHYKETTLRFLAWRNVGDCLNLTLSLLKYEKKNKQKKRKKKQKERAAWFSLLHFISFSNIMDSNYFTPAYPCPYFLPSFLPSIDPSIDPAFLPSFPPSLLPSYPPPYSCLLPSSLLPLPSLSPFPLTPLSPSLPPHVPPSLLTSLLVYLFSFLLYLLASWLGKGVISLDPFPKEGSTGSHLSNPSPVVSYTWSTYSDLRFQAA